MGLKISCYFILIFLTFSVFSNPINDSKSRTKRNLMLNGRWPTANIPVHIDTFYTPEHQNEILQAMAMIENVSCVRFVTYNPILHFDWVHVRPNNVDITTLERRCDAQIGYQGGYQHINIPVRPGEDCFGGVPGRISHQFLHSLGFTHMHNTAERDQYVQINWENIREGAERYFDIVPNTRLNGFPYDFGSIMHCGSQMHSDVGNPTFTPLVETGGLTIGQRARLSQGDIDRLNAWYCE